MWLEFSRQGARKPSRLRYRLPQRRTVTSRKKIKIRTVMVRLPTKLQVVYPRPSKMTRKVKERTQSTSLHFFITSMEMHIWRLPPPKVPMISLLNRLLQYFPLSLYMDTHSLFCRQITASASAAITFQLTDSSKDSLLPWFWFRQLLWRLQRHSMNLLVIST